MQNPVSTPLNSVIGRCLYYERDDGGNRESGEGGVRVDQVRRKRDLNLRFET